MRTLKADQFCPHLPPFGSNNSIQAFFPTFSPKGLKANGQKALFISQKPSKNWIFGKNGLFLTVFGQKWPIFEFFSKIRLEHFFTFPKPYLTAKFQKKVMSGCPDIA